MTLAAPLVNNPRLSAICTSLSTPRLGPYLTAAGGNIQAAVRLYEWNVELSGAVYEALHVVEVVLRNALDQQLSAWNANQTDRHSGRPHSPDWLTDPSRLIQRLLGADLPRAHTRARQATRAGKPGGRSPSHPDLLAQLTFGTWRYLLPDRDAGRQLLWNQALHLAFPHLTITPGDLVHRIDGIYRHRNRSAHLEPLLRGRVVRTQFNNMRTGLAAINPYVEDWFVSNQRVTRSLRNRQP
ncbi:MAG: hypothetical protein FWD74_01005 [Actinomycetia bacterium]|nr:hypothetical protein [Actinomycetes bacterium]